MGRTPRVFFDADALFAGAHSPSGGAALLLNLAGQKRIVALVSPLVLEECRRNLARKEPSGLLQIAFFLDYKIVALTPQPSLAILGRYARFADRKDAPHVAAAHESRADYLVTFNLRHYRIVEIESDLKIKVRKPGTVLHELRLSGVL